LMNDRYLYFPMLGAAASYGMLTLPSAGHAYDFRRRSIAIILILLIIPLPWLSWQRTSVWSNDTSLWTDATRKTPGSPLAWNGLGMSYVEAGRPDEAAAAFLKALAIDPDYKLSLNNIGALYNSRGKILEARPFLLKVTGLFPEDVNGLMNLGINYSLSHEFQDAEQIFKRVLAVQPQFPQALTLLGDAYLGMKKPEMAGKYYKEAIEIGGSTAYLEFRIAGTEALSAHPRKALEHLESAFKLGYDDFENVMKDATLDPLRGHADFQTLLRKYFGR